MSKDLAITGIIMLLSYIQPTWAGERGLNEGQHHGAQYEDSTGDVHIEGMKGLLLKKEIVDDYQVTFHVMKAVEGEIQGCAYQFMFRVEQKGKAIHNLIVNSRVRHPNNQSESKMMMKVGDWYTAAYDLTHPGEHQLLVLFKIKGGSKHSAKVSYMVEKQE